MFMKLRIQFKKLVTYERKERRVLEKLQSINKFGMKLFSLLEECNSHDVGKKRVNKFIAYRGLQPYSKCFVIVLVTLHIKKKLAERFGQLDSRWNFLKIYLFKYLV